jgi:hypothetical protein
MEHCKGKRKNTEAFQVTTAHYFPASIQVNLLFVHEDGKSPWKPWCIIESTRIFSIDTRTDPAA